MKTAILVGLIIGAIGCGTTEDDPCYVRPTSNVGYHDCGTASNGMENVTLCGQLPQNGSSGSLIPVGCTVQVGTSTPETAICLESCP